MNSNQIPKKSTAKLIRTQWNNKTVSSIVKISNYWINPKQIQ